LGGRLKKGRVPASASRFADSLTDWYRRERRDLPWRRTNDPYRILVSEIMLQQTRAQTVIPYYERFIERFPDVKALSDAGEAQVLTYWSGLGYYSRARNLQRAARVILASGQFPSDYDGIRELPGVGPYTAAAVASIAFNAPHAVVDGNVLRVIARLSDDGADIASSKTLARFQQIADQWLDHRHPGQFNQAMMELGATICLPRKPHCPLCPVAKWCEGRKAGRQYELPVKRSKAEPRHIQIQVAIIQKAGSVLLRRRPAGASQMPGFWELPAPDDLPSWRAREALGSFRHTITNHHYTVTVLRGTVTRVPPGFQWQRNGIDRIPLTTVTKKAMSLITSE
jgi:A/G-specific adenine glycosylase